MVHPVTYDFDENNIKHIKECTWWLLIYAYLYLWYVRQIWIFFTNGSYLLNSPKIKDMCPNLIQLADREEDIYTGKQK